MTATVKIIIASGKYPVFIDLETLMQAETVLNN
jgi:lantibiotic modifying enzyme